MRKHCRHKYSIIFCTTLHISNLATCRPLLRHMCTNISNSFVGKDDETSINCKFKFNTQSHFGIHLQQKLLKAFLFLVSHTIPSMQSVRTMALLLLFTGYHLCKHKVYVLDICVHTHTHAHTYLYYVVVRTSILWEFNIMQLQEDVVAKWCH